MKTISDLSRAEISNYTSLSKEKKKKPNNEKPENPPSFKQLPSHLLIYQQDSIMLITNMKYSH